MRKLRGIGALRAPLLDLLWRYAPVSLRERLVWLRAPKFLVTVNGVCVNPRNEALLLEQRFTRGERWNMPGGFVKHNEHPETTLLREIREETGLEATISSLLWVFHARRQIHLCYLCFVPDGPLALQGSEILSHEWLDLGSADPRRILERRRAAEVLAEAQLGSSRVVLTEPHTNAQPDAP
jgi:ADP-ribose pyrophosphatase YjhB (NUDIX family)